MIVVLDTNVWISALRFATHPWEYSEADLRGKMTDPRSTSPSLHRVHARFPFLNGPQFKLNQLLQQLTGKILSREDLRECF